MIKSLQRTLDRRPWIIPLGLALLFIIITLPGIDWGIPNGWNPDELIQRVTKALHGEWVFDETNFDYPSLPKYAMFWLGKWVFSLGYGDAEAMWAARALSVLIGAALVALTYSIARGLGASIIASSLAAILLLSSSELAQHARFAHNDIYLAFFVALSVSASLRFAQEDKRSWFYFACFSAGLAASSKYNGGAILLLPLLLFFIQRGHDLLRDRLRGFEILTLGFLSAFAAFALGTPRALTWMSFYFKRLIPALGAHASYGYRPGAQTGLQGQFQVLPNVFGFALFWLALAALAYFIARALRAARLGGLMKASPLLVLPLAVLAYDLPIMFSYNYPERFFLPLLPLFALMIAFSTEAAWAWLSERAQPAARWALAAGLALILAFSFLRVASVALLFQNDARIPAGEFMAELPQADSVEYTLYPPILDRALFGRAHNYPLFFPKQPGEQLPAGKLYDFNTGLAGLNERQTQYLVIDSFTYDRFADDYTCELVPADCAFFRNLLAGQTQYELIAAFDYRLPAWLPDVPLSFLNPDIKIFQLTLAK